MHRSEKVIAIRGDSDIVQARLEGRALASAMGFSESDQVLIATAISEAARNILQYAHGGEVALATIGNGNHKVGIEIIARDKGPGIDDVHLAMQDGFSSSGGLGLGLPGIKRLMSELKIKSTPGKGTTLTLRKWKP